MAPDPHPILSLPLLDREGRTTTLGAVAAKAPLVAVFLRHFG